VANALETKCSIRNAPTGIMPLSECSLRSQNEYPWPARRGGTPSWPLMGAAGLAVVATRPLVKSEMIRELFIILVKEKGSQGRQRVGWWVSLKFRYEWIPVRLLLGIARQTRTFDSSQVRRRQAKADAQTKLGVRLTDYRIVIRSKGRLSSRICRNLHENKAPLHALGAVQQKAYFHVPIPLDILRTSYR
jgi:hypothetical protein